MVGEDLTVCFKQELADVVSQSFEKCLSQQVVGSYEGLTDSYLAKSRVQRDKLGVCIKECENIMQRGVGKA